MNNIQNYGMTNYQIGFRSNKSKAVAQKIENGVKNSQRYKELVNRMQEINDIENNVIKERGFGYAKYYMEKFSPEITKISTEMKQLEGVLK